MEKQAYVPWNKGKLVGQKLPLKQRDIWSIRVRLQLANCVRDLALFNLAIDSKLRGCDLVSLRVKDLGDGCHIASRAIVMQQKTKRPVQFEMTEGTRQALASWIEKRRLRSDDYIFPSRTRVGAHLSTRQYARIVHRWVGLLLGHTKLESTVRYLGIEVDDALEIAEQRRFSPAAARGHKRAATADHRRVLKWPLRINLTRAHLTFADKRYTIIGK